MEINMPSNYHDPNKDFKKKWDANSGWLGHPEKKEKALEAQKKGGQISAAKRKARAAARRLLQDKHEFLLNAAANATAENPDWMEKTIKMFMDIIDDPNSDVKDKMMAADRLTSIVGTQAPKQTEQKIRVEETDIQDDVDKLKALGVNVEGLKIVK